ncbi:hypothetical protein AAFF_G00035000 [Aldrovandia affinis]|uniref:Telethonin n=1 Tax=Aldrovandia affinis TaxID=143900 RepID=A0AAD7S3S8_9TELE|nr:hypothetical protein AAFF_G00035000 [Aldrovandia affinis]
MLCLNRKTSSNLVNVYCDVAEDNEKDREHYQSSWLELVMETRPQEKLALLEKDTSKKESYEQEQVTHFLVRRSPEQTIGLGRQGEKLKEYQLPYKNVLPVPVFLPSKAVQFKDSERASTPAELKSIMEFEKALSSGVCADKRAVSQITKDMPKITQPISVNFSASCLVSPPGGTSHSPQKRS